MAKGTIRLPFPIGGLNKAAAYGAQPPYTSADMLNVRAFDSAKERARGGQRPGTKKAFSDQLGSGNPVRMLSQLVQTYTYSTTTVPAVEEDLFDRANAQTLGDSWTDAWPFGIGGGTDTFYISENKAAVPRLDEAAAYFRLVDLDTSNDYSVELDICKDRSGYIARPEWQVYMYVRLDDSTPDIEQDGTEVRLRLQYQSGGTINVTPRIRVYVGGTKVAEETFAVATTTEVQQTAKLAVSGNVITVSLKGAVIATKTVAAQTGKGTGMGLANYSYRSDRAKLDNWRISGMRTLTATEPLPRRTILLASANGTLYEENADGSLGAVAGAAADFSSGYAFMAEQAYGNLYIADYAPARVHGTDGVISGAGNNILDAVSVTDWTAHNIDPDTDVVVLSTVTGPTAGNYKITSVVAGQLNINGNAGAGGTCTYYVEKAPKVYTPGLSGGTVAIWTATAGNVPMGCRIMAVYRGRIVLAHQDYDEQNWFMSKQGDPLDWNYAAEGAQRAVAGSNTDAGKVGDIITAAIPWSDDYLIWGCSHSLWRLSGDPAAGGVNDALSYKTGILDKFAWCQDPDGRIYFMGDEGLYLLLPGGVAQNISKRSLPSDLAYINVDNYEVVLSWSAKMWGVFIFVTSRASGDSQHWFYDLRADGFFPVQIPGAQGPMLALNYHADAASRRDLLLGGRDGYIRKFDPDALDDDGTAINSFVTIGPFYPVGPNQEVVLSSVDVALAEQTSQLTWEVRRGQTAEAAVDSSAWATETWYGDALRYTIPQRVRGSAFAFRLSNSTAGKWWGLEDAQAVVTGPGKRRKWPQR